MITRIIAVCTLALTISPVMIVDSSGASSRKEFVIRRCKERAENKSHWQKGHYAFATNKKWDVCGWAYKHEKAKYAGHAALRNCNHRSKTPCRLIYVK